MVFSQNPGRKWVTILDLDDQKVFVDTSTIKEYQNQISVLSITIFKTPQKIETIDGLASSVKSRILFNLSLQKYSTVGTLYYDDKLKILGETSLPGFAGNSEAFSVSIDSNQVVATIYSYCLKYINRGARAISEKEFSSHSNQTRIALDKLAPKQNTTEQKREIEANAKKEKVFESKKENDVNPNNADTNEKKKENSSDIKLDNRKEKSVSEAGIIKAAIKPVQPDTTIKVIDNLAQKRAEALKTLTAKKTEINKSSEEKTKKETNSTQSYLPETNPKETIFLDDGKYSFQVSSWKSKSKAESEVSKLKSQGHNAFVVEALVNKQRGTWYRVRIGYFNSVEETEAYKTKLK